MGAKESLHLTDEPPALFKGETLGLFELGETESYTVTFGLSGALVEQLVAYSGDSSDTILHEFTSDRKRFKDVEAYKAWYGKVRFPFALVSGDGRLAALIWYGPSEFPELDEGGSPDSQNEWDTIAFRSYPPFRGQGFMKGFSELVLSHHKFFRPHHDIWLETRIHNESAQSLYEKLGFEVCGSCSDGRDIVMSLSKEREE